MKKGFILIVILVASLPLVAQQIIGVGTKWNDAFAEWTIHTEEEGEEGELKLKWSNDWTKWDFEVLGEYGNIEPKWRGDLSLWEVRGNEDIVEAKMVWTDDVREWRITDNTHTIVLESKWSNDLNRWEVDSPDYGTYIINTIYRNDPREWEVLDELTEDISLTMKMAIVFIVTFHAAPK